jgi:ATP-dependent RNA helicase RhlE
MGRQTIWGGLGKPPSREVMAAAAKAARSEMMQRIRDNKGADAQRGSRNGNGARTGSGNGSRSGAGSGTRNGAAQPQGQRAQAPRPPQNARPAQSRNGYGNGAGNVNGGNRPRDDGEAQPRDGAHNIASPFVQRAPTPRNTDGQPDPLRTSVDSMGGRGRRGNGGGRSNRSGGGGFGPRGAGNPARTFGR